MRVIFSEETKTTIWSNEKNTGTAENRRTLPKNITKVVHVSRKIK